MAADSVAGACTIWWRTGMSAGGRDGGFTWDGDGGFTWDGGWGGGGGGECGGAARGIAMRCGKGVVGVGYIGVASGI